MRIITLIFLFISTAAISQGDRFSVSPEGFGEYVVLEFEGKSSSDIFTGIKKWSEYNIRNAGVSNYSEIQDEYLGYSIVIPAAIYVDTGSFIYDYDIHMDVEIRIKDNRLRIDLELKKMPDSDNYRVPPLTLDGRGRSPFDRKGNLKKDQYKQEVVAQINEIANTIILRLSEAVNGKPDYEKEGW